MRTLLVSIVLISLPVLSALADDPPPQGAKPLSELLSGDRYVAWVKEH